MIACDSNQGETLDPDLEVLRLLFRASARRTTRGWFPWKAVALDRGLNVEPAIGLEPHQAADPTHGQLGDFLRVRGASLQGRSASVPFVIAIATPLRSLGGALAMRQFPR